MRDKRYEIKAKGGEGAELLIYGDIGESWDEQESNDAKTIVKEMQALNGVPLDVRVSSYGGAVADGIAIHNALRRYKGPTTAHIEGVAFSIASLIPMGADQVVMAANALFMIHAPWAMALGNAAEMRKMADVLDITADAMVSGYVRKGGPSKEFISDLLNDGDDHYYTAAEAQEAGFVDYITGSIDIASALRGSRYHPPATAGINKTEAAMPEEKTIEGGASEPSNETFLQAHAKAVAAGQEKGQQAENLRQRVIWAAFAELASDDPTDPMCALRDQCLADIHCGEAQANSRIIAALKQRTDAPIPFTPQAAVQSPSGGVYSASAISRERPMATGPDGLDKFVAGATKAIEIRAGLERDRAVIEAERSGQFLSMTLKELCRASLAMAGMPVHGTDQDVIRRVLAAGPGQGTDHFPAILENIANKSVMDGFMAAPESWNAWTQVGVLNDYRTASRVNKSLFDSLDKMEEYEKFQSGRFADVKQAITAYLHGKSFSLTLQAISNDDLSMLTEDARAWGEAANRTIGDAVFMALTAAGTGGFGQTMTEDSTVLFHANHSNYIASGSGAAPSKATIGAGRTAMMTQTDPNGVVVASPPKYLLHPTTLTLDVTELLTSQYYVTGDAGDPANNAVASLGLMGVEEYRLDSFVDTAWILAAARRTVEVAFVGGQSTPRVDRMPSGEIPGITWQISIPFGVAALDYRTHYLNYGA